MMDPKYNEGRKICTYLSEVYPELFVAANLAVAFTSESYVDCWQLYLKEFKVVDSFLELPNYRELLESGTYHSQVADMLRADFARVDLTRKNAMAISTFSHLILGSMGSNGVVDNPEVKMLIPAQIIKH
jgi:hypothetical protein